LPPGVSRGPNWPRGNLKTGAQFFDPGIFPGVGPFSKDLPQISWKSANSPCKNLGKGRPREKEGKPNVSKGPWGFTPKPSGTLGPKKTPFTRKGKIRAAGGPFNSGSLATPETGGDNCFPPNNPLGREYFRKNSRGSQSLKTGGVTGNPWVPGGNPRKNSPWKNPGKFVGQEKVPGNQFFGRKFNPVEKTNGNLSTGKEFWNGTQVPLNRGNSKTPGMETLPPWAPNKGRESLPGFPRKKFPGKALIPRNSLSPEKRVIFWKPGETRWHPFHRNRLPGLFFWPPGLGFPGFPLKF